MRIPIVVVVICLFLPFFAVPGMCENILYSYDALGNLVTIMNSDGGVSIFKYDESGNQLRKERKPPADDFSIEIAGPDELEENSHGYYSIRIIHGADSKAVVSGKGIWADQSSIVEFDETEPGLLITGKVDWSRIAIIGATYEHCNQTKSASKSIVVRDVAPEGSSTCQGYPVRVLKNNVIVDCFLTISAAYMEAHHGSLIQAQGPTNRIDLASSKDKEITIEGYQGPDFKNPAGVTLDSLELSSGTLIFR